MGCIHSRRHLMNSKDEEEEEDFISNLPDEIIVSVVSLLDTIEEQARTSVLSRRWRYLWKLSTTTNLVLVLNNRDRRSELVRRVNQIIKAMPKATNIGNFHLVFGSCGEASIYQHYVDEWLNFALLQKRAKRINLDLCFEYKISSYSLSNSQVMSRIRTQSLVLDSLKSLRLGHVDVSGEDLKYILYSASPLLEELSIFSPGPSLVSFTVSGWSLRLKHLEFESSVYVEHIDIHNVNLESLEYTGRGTCLTIRNTPRLVKACFPMFWYIGDVNFGSHILSNLPQLQTLVWRPYPVDQILQQLNQLPEFPKLRNLKQLEIEIGSYIFCVRLCAQLLDSSPLLSEFKLKFDFLGESDKEDKVSGLKNPHQSLKVVEIVGFIGCQLDLGVALYLIENTACLEKMIVDTDHSHTLWRVVDKEKQRAARVLAITHLEPTLSLQTKMIVK